jgi:hypothetical protein
VEKLKIELKIEKESKILSHQYLDSIQNKSKVCLISLSLSLSIFYFDNNSPMIQLQLLMKITSHHQQVLNYKI